MGLFRYRLSAEDLRFDEDWGIRVQSVDPLPGQPGLAEGDFIVAIDGAQNYVGRTILWPRKA